MYSISADSNVVAVPHKINTEKSVHGGNFVRIKNNSLLYVLLFIFQCNCTTLKKAEYRRMEYDDVSAAATVANDDNGYDTMIVTVIMMMINSRQL